MRKILLTVFAFMCFVCVESKIRIEIKNPSHIERKMETVEVKVTDISSKVSLDKEIVVLDEKGVQIPSQITSDGLLIFQTTLRPGVAVLYTVTNGKRDEYNAKAYGRLVPERKDDWAWENDRIAFRMYGPALEATGELSNGIDVWVKRTSDLIINEWYKPGVDYHKDHGQGLDYYKVGRTLGAGAMAPISDSSFVLANNFVEAQLVDSGVIRHSFLLTYAPYRLNGKSVTETRLISLDAGSHLNRITETYTGDFEEIDVAAGITLRSKGEIVPTKQSVVYVEPSEGSNGTTFLALIMPHDAVYRKIDNHAALVTKAGSGKSLTYYNGAGWSKGGFGDASQWKKYISDRIIQINNPLTITIK